MVKDAALQRQISVMAVSGVSMDHRIISDGDELCLLPEELDAFATSVLKVRRASGAARIVARELLSDLGHSHQAIPKSASGAPIWPSGIVGSLAHDSRVAVAAVAMRRDFCSVGVDVEPTAEIDADICDLVLTKSERQGVHKIPHFGRLIFAVKEAVYKAVYPLDRTFLEYHDVEVSLSEGTAAVRTGRVVPFHHCVGDHIIALAFIPSSP